MSDYYEYTAITKIEYVNEYPMTLPTLTLCLDSLEYLPTNISLRMSLLTFSIGGVECDL